MSQTVYSSWNADIEDGLASLKANLARNLPNLLAESKLTQREFAKKVGVGESTASGWFSGLKLPRDQHWGPICAILKCTIEDLVREDGIPQTHQDPVLRYLRKQVNALGYDIVKKS